MRLPTWYGVEMEVDSLAQLTPNLGPEGHRSYRFLRWVLSGAVRRFESDLDRPEAAQKRRLEAIVKGMRGTRFAAEHGIGDRIDGAEFRERVPVRTAEEYRDYLDAVASGGRMVLTKQAPTMLLETSGTTGRPKHLPVTAAWAESVQMAQRLWTLALVRDHPELAAGKAFTLVSPAVHGISPGGLPIGSNTGRIRAAQPFWLRGRYAVPTDAMQIEDSAARQYTALRFGLAADVRSVTTANPSLVLLLFRRAMEWESELRADLESGTLRHGPAASIPDAVRGPLERMLKPEPRLSSIHPCDAWNLLTVNTWTNGPAAYFADRLSHLLGDVPVRELGISASEGSIAFPLDAAWPGSVLWVGGHVMEFATECGQVLWAHELEEGMRARVILTTSSGLYRYDMDDEIEVVGHCLRTPVVRFIGKHGRYLNAVGERVSEAQVSMAMGSVGAVLDGFTVGIQSGEVPNYTVAVEGDCEVSAVAMNFDHSLAQLNVEYASKRASGRLGPPEGRRLSPGHYARYRSRMVASGAPAGQLKDPIIAIDASEWIRVLAEQS